MKSLSGLGSKPSGGEHVISIKVDGLDNNHVLRLDALGHQTLQYLGTTILRNLKVPHDDGFSFTEDVDDSGKPKSGGKSLSLSNTVGALPVSKPLALVTKGSKPSTFAIVSKGAAAFTDTGFQSPSAFVTPRPGQGQVVKVLPPSATGGHVMIFQLGTNNWQTQGAFAPGSGILHEAHHVTYNGLADTQSFSIWPSKTQTPESDDYEIFKLTHDIPIAESVSPVSSYRWHAMTDDEFAAYRERLTNECLEYMDKCEQRTGKFFTHALAHHTFLNPLVLKDVLAERKKQGKPDIPLGVFAHGTALKMFEHEKDPGSQEEYPRRFLPIMEENGVFESSDSVTCVFAISEQQMNAFSAIYPNYPKDKMIVSPNGINQNIFCVNPSLTRATVLPEFQTDVIEGSGDQPRTVPGDADYVITFVGKFANWKRLDTVLQAAQEYEKWAEGQGKTAVTLIVGSGPADAKAKYHGMAKDLGLKHAYFLGPRSHQELAKLYNVSDVGVFPSWSEPFGLVFIECMGCGTPAIGADSGGPRDFVTPDVGFLVKESPSMEETEEFVKDLTAAITKSLTEDWKSSKSAACQRLAVEEYSLIKQCSGILKGMSDHFQQ